MSVSELVRQGASGDCQDIMHYLSDRVPLFYREVNSVVSTLEDGLFLSAFKETLSRLPTSALFRESHFGEILSGVLAEDVMGWRLLYSKLSLNTAQNQNALKIDIVLYDPQTEPVDFIFGSVKSSPKQDVPAHHDSSCYSDLFRSFREYTGDDFTFDLSAAADHLAVRDPAERDRVRRALRPYGSRSVRFAGFALIDLSTRNDDEMGMLATRKSKRPFDIEVLCVETYQELCDAVYSNLDKIGRSCLP